MRHLFFTSVLGLFVFNQQLWSQTQSYASSDRPVETSEYSSGLNRWFFNGNISPWIGNPTSINLSPLVGYRVTQRYLVGAGGIYNYFRQRTSIEVFKTYSYGFRAFQNYLLTDQIFAGIEYDVLNYEPYNFITGETYGRRWAHVPLVGGGLTSRLGQSGRMFVSIMYNLNYTSRGPYGNIVPRLSFAF